MGKVGVSIREKVWLENSLSQLEGGCRGRGGSVYKAGSERVTTHMEAAGGYVKELWSCQSGPWDGRSKQLSKLFLNLVIIHLLACEDGTDRVFRNVEI
jgi:hypothetical protein